MSLRGPKGRGNLKRYKQSWGLYKIGGSLKAVGFGDGFEYQRLAAMSFRLKTFDFLAGIFSAGLFQIDFTYIR